MRKAIAVFAVTLAFGLASCDDGGMEDDLFSGDNPFVGTWKNDLITYIFTETEVDFYYTNMYGDYSVHHAGTYTYDDTHLVIRWNKTETDDLIDDVFLINGNLLILEGIPYSKISKSTQKP